MAASTLLLRNKAFYCLCPREAFGYRFRLWLSVIAFRFSDQILNRSAYFLFLKTATAAAAETAGMSAIAIPVGLLSFLSSPGFSVSPFMPVVVSAGAVLSGSVSSGSVTSGPLRERIR